MVVHQHVRVHCHAQARCVLGEQRQHAFTVGRADEHVLAVVAALDHVVQPVGQREAGQAGH